MSRLASRHVLASLLLRCLLLVGLCGLPPLASSVQVRQAAAPSPVAETPAGGTLTGPAGGPARRAASPVAGGVTANAESAGGPAKAEKYAEARAHGRKGQGGPPSVVDTSVGQMTLSATINAVCSGCPYWVSPTWKSQHPATSPMGLEGPAMVYDAARKQNVLFGGWNNGPQAGTWTFDGTTWTQKTPATSPSARSDAAMAYDESSQQLVLYGGAVGSTTYSAETWTFNGTTWTLVGTQGPGGLYGPSLAYNPALGRVVMFGGYSDSANDNQSMSYVYSGGTWGMLGVPTTPAARYHAAMAQSPRNGQLTLVGGTDSFSYFDSTHTFDWPRAGFQAGFKHERQQLTDRVSLATNVAGGNATVVANDLSLPGEGVGLSLTRHYNSQQALLDYDKGYGWFFDTGQDLWIASQPDGSKLLSGYAGSSFGGAYFRRNSDGSYLTPPGVNAVLRQAGGNYTVTYHADGRVQTFRDSDGALTSDLDRNGNGLRFTYSGATLMSISNNEGRTVTFTYTNGQITKITDSSGRSVSYSYTSGYLTGVTDAGGRTTGYSYDTGSGAMTSITDALGNVTKLAMNEANELASVTRVTDTAAGTGPTTTYTYSPPVSGDTGAVLRTLSVAPNQQGTSTGTTYVTNHAGAGD